MSAIELYNRPSPDHAEKVSQALMLLRKQAAQHPRLIQASSLGAEDMVVTHLIHLANIDCGVFVLDTGKLHAETLALIGQIYEAERQAQGVEADERLRIRQQQSRSAVDRLHLWLTEHRGKVPSGSATAKAMDYSLRRWPALTRFLEDGRIPIDNNWVENQMRPIALGRKNWLFAGSLRAGQRAAAIMSLIQSAKLNGLDPYAYLKDVMDRLPTWPNSRIGELLPHRWNPSTD